VRIYGGSRNFTGICQQSRRNVHSNDARNVSPRIDVSDHVTEPLFNTATQTSPKKRINNDLGTRKKSPGVLPITRRSRKRDGAARATITIEIYPCVSAHFFRPGTQNRDGTGAARP
jgi:hypothetical protein